jgi:uncharacterized protein
MPEYLSPGVYVEEIQTGPRPIEGVSTSTAGMVGRTERGPEYPRLVSSWLEFQRWYGGYLPIEQSYFPYAVQGFFDNGGQRLFVTRATGPGAAFAAADIENGALHAQTVGKGTWGNRVYVRVSPASKRNDTNNYFRLDVFYFTERQMPDGPIAGDALVDPLDPAQLKNPARIEPDRIESYDNLVHTQGSANNVMSVLNSASQLIRVWFLASPAAPVTVDPNAARIIALTGGLEPTAGYDVASYVGNREAQNFTDAIAADLYGRGQGLEALQAIDEIALLAIPDEVLAANPDAGVAAALRQLSTEVVNRCELLRDRFGVVSSDRGLTDPVGVNPLTDTSYAAFYYPWIEIYDPVSRGPILVPPTGHVLGIIARTDIERGVFKAPANEVVRDATNLDFAVTKGMQDILNPKGVNCIRDFRSDGRGIRLWGARTMSSDAMWKYVNVRRLFIFIEESIDEGTQWVVFEPNDEPLWANVRRSISSFLFGIWRSGALMGLTQEEAFFVKCDRTTMTQDDIDNGRLVCYIGIAPVKPAEFVIFRISQKTAEAPA